LLRRHAGSPAGKKFYDNLKLNFPLIGSIYRMIIVSRFAKTLGTLLKSGVPIIKSLDIAKTVVNNIFVEEAIERIRDDIEEGGSLAVSMKNYWFFPAIVIHMVSVGERSGELEAMLFSISKTYEDQIDNTTSALTSILEPVMILIMGGMVFFIMISILIPIFQLNQLVR